jgi:hypothetical protein
LTFDGSNLYVGGNITIGGTTAFLAVNELKVTDKDIIVGYTTNALNQDISTDITASSGGIAVASTEGSPLISMNSGGEITPDTYKQIMWFKSGAFAGLNTDAWLFNYGVGIGSTQVPYGVRLAAGGMQVTDTTVSSPYFDGTVTKKAITGQISTSSVTSDDLILVYDNVTSEIYKTSILNAALQGNQGTQGTQGTLGSQGTQGTQGRQGSQGILGSQGTQGTQGVGTQGTQGSQGVGSQGTQGTQGVGSQGTQGTQGVGSQGTQGTQGVGSQGTQGSQGVGSQGSQGTQGTQGVGSQGTQGTQGVGTQGTQGSQGILGSQGTQGSQGVGTQGTQGSQGVGSQGSQGTQGTQGVGSQGTQGTQGLQGLQGVSIQGVQGPSGTSGGGGSGGINYWEQTGVGINTLSRVGIGTTNPTSLLTVKSQSVTDFVGLFTGTTDTDLVRITQDGLGNALRVDDQAGGTTPFIVDNNGRVGINTLTATSNLTVFGDSRITGISTSGYLDGNPITTLSGSILAYSYRMIMP